MSNASNAPLSVQEMPVTYKTLQTLSTSPTIPKQYQGKPNDMLAVALQGRELGIGPLTSVNNIDMIDGTISMRAKLMSALIFGAGHIIKTIEASEDMAHIRCYRYHPQLNELIDVGELTWTREDAERAGDIKKGTYSKYIKNMLMNRALTFAARTFYGDCLAGIGYTADEVGFTDDLEQLEDVEQILKDELNATEVEVVEEAEVIDDE